MKILHFSDLHLQDRLPPGISWIFDKRLLGTCTQHLRRAPKQNFQTIPQLLALAKAEKPDAIICTGDLCSVALPAEFQRAWKELKPFKELVKPENFIFIPGNHDRYINREDARTALRRISQKLNSTETDVDFHSLQRKLGNVTCLTLDAARPRPFWSSGGIAAPQQIRELKDMTDSPLADRELRILLCHFPLQDKNGNRLSFRRRMTGDLRVRKLLTEQNFTAILCGHIHTPFIRQVDGILQICPGSLTLHHQAAFIDIRETDLTVRLQDVLTGQQKSFTEIFRKQ